MGPLEFSTTFLSDGAIPPLIWGLALLGGVAVVAVAVARGRGFGHRYESCAVLNNSERTLHGTLLAAIAELPQPRPLLLCQVSYGEFLRCKDRKGFWRINAKRADFLVVDRGFSPRMVIEYQGSGHYGSTFNQRLDARRRDRVKRDACTSAGIPWLEVPPKYDARSVRALVISALVPAQPLPAEAKGPGHD
jgi:hypothetical protein